MNFPKHIYSLWFISEEGFNEFEQINYFTNLKECKEARNECIKDGKDTGLDWKYKILTYKLVK